MQSDSTGTRAGSGRLPSGVTTGDSSDPKEDVAQAQALHRAACRLIETLPTGIVDPAAMEFQVALGNLLGR